jgi:hypothetical protein
LSTGSSAGRSWIWRELAGVKAAVFARLQATRIGR